MAEPLRRTRSVCPICLAPVEASLIRHDSAVYLHKTCPRHGDFAVPIWRDYLDLERWCAGATELSEDQGLGCPENCGICGEHEQGSCCVLLEVTGRCDLRCRYCFARGGETANEPSLEELKAAVSDILELAGRPLLQLSGGEPALRDDLPELVAYARRSGCPYVQLNTNGLRLAEDKEYLRRLADAGLSFVFLQFDAASDEAHIALRGRPLLETKLRAIENCDERGLGVTLVPTIVRGVNDSGLCDIVRLAASLSPAVRGVHFQPAALLGRFPSSVDAARRYTLDELIRDLSLQAGLDTASFRPSRCDHPLCGFHGSFLVGENGRLAPASGSMIDGAPRVSAVRNRDYIGRRWLRDRPPVLSDREPPCCGQGSGEIPDFSTFLRRQKARSFTLTAMAFQDALSLDVERLRRCSLHVYEKGRIKPFCARYLTASSSFSSGMAPSLGAASAPQ